MDFISIIAIFFALLSLPGTIELFLLTIGGILPSKRELNFIKNIQRYNHKLAIVIPTHEFGDSLERTISSLVHAEEHLNIFLVTNKTTDTIKQIIKKWKIHLIEVKNDHNLLKEASEKLLSENYDVYTIVKSHSTISPNISYEILRMIDNNIKAIQIFNIVIFSKKVKVTFKGKIMLLGFLALNHFRPLARTKLGFSCGLCENGFALTRKTLFNVPIEKNTEPLSYHLRLVTSKEKVVFNPRTKIFYFTDDTEDELQEKIFNWERKKLALLYQNFGLIIKNVFKGNLLLLEPFLDFLLLPIPYHSLLLLFSLFIPYSPTQIYAIIAWLVLTLYFLAFLKVSRGNFKDFLIIIYFPLYFLWKIMNIPKNLTKLFLQKS